MAFGRLARTPRPPPMGDINMTPLIDVMLVLLVVFMVTAPLMSSSLQLDLPQAGAAQPADAGAAASLAVAIDAQGRLSLGEVGIDDATLQKRMAAAAASDPATEVQLRADKTVPYGKVAQLIDLVQGAGLSRIGFVASPASAGAMSVPTPTAAAARDPQRPEAAAPAAPAVPQAPRARPAPSARQ